MTSEPPEGWVRPWWAERQLDANSAAYAPTPSEVEYWSDDRRVRECVLANTQGRSWTTIGLPEMGDRAAVDPRGLVVWPRWSLDWWVRAGEQWVFPSRAVTVRQRLADDMPVVETILRVGGGEVVHRVSAARGTAVRIDNASPSVGQSERQHLLRRLPRPLRRFMPFVQRETERPAEQRNRQPSEQQVRQQTQQTKWHKKVTRREQASNAAASAVPEVAVPEVFVVEIVNHTPAPVAVALAARPCNLGAFEHVNSELWEWSTAWGINEVCVDGSVMTLDDGSSHVLGRATVIFDRVPGDVVMGSHGTDSAALLAASDSHRASGTSVTGPVAAENPATHEPATGEAVTHETVTHETVTHETVTHETVTGEAATGLAASVRTGTEVSDISADPISPALSEQAKQAELLKQVEQAAQDVQRPEQTKQPEKDPNLVVCPQHLANATAVFPLVSGATLRAAVIGRDQPFNWDDIGWDDIGWDDIGSRALGRSSHGGAVSGSAALGGAVQGRSAGGGAVLGSAALGGAVSGSAALGTAVLDAVPGLDRVANGWRQRVDAGCRLELPPGRLATAALSARAAQLLSTAPFDDGTGPGPMLASALDTDCNLAGDDLVQLLALVESGLSEQVRDLLIRQAQAQDISGMTTAMGTSVTGTSLVLAEHLLSLHPDPAYAEALGEFVTSGARWLLTRHAPQQEEPWTIREGLRASYRLLMRLGAERAANALQREAMSLPEALRLDVRAAPTSAVSYRDRWGRLPWEVSRDSAPRESIQKSTRQQPTSQQQASQRWAWVAHDTGLWIHAAVPWAPPLPFVTAELTRHTPVDFAEDTATSCGYDLVATALLAFAEARPAPARAFERLEALVSVATPTMNWPTFMHPELRTGTNGTGHDLVVGGTFVRTLLRLLVDAPDSGASGGHSPGGHSPGSHRSGSHRPGGGVIASALANPAQPKLRFAAHWPAAWLGQPVEVHDLPSRIGSVSWAVRWHGERPALLWEVNPHDPDGVAPTVTAPGLDDSFTATGLRGEALLAPCSP